MIKKKSLNISFNSTFILLLLLLVISCGYSPGGLAAPGQEEFADDPDYEVFVVQQRWHTGIVFHTRDVDPDIWPEIERYTDRNFVDVGWGDERFYQATGDPVGLALRSMLISHSKCFTGIPLQPAPSQVIRSGCQDYSHTP
jgi:hypothetical protein